MRLTARRGHLLAEALCALALSGVLGVAAALSLGSARRALTSTDRLARADRAALESVHISAAMLTGADSVRIEGDTAVSLAVAIGTGVVCARPGRAIVLSPMVVASGSAMTARSQPLEPGDLVSILVADSLARQASWMETSIDSVGLHTDPSSCAAADGWMRAGDDASSRARLVLSDSLPESVVPGSPVRILRRGRLALYHAGSGDWMLGWRRCSPDGSSCGATQPVAGPLRTPLAGGLRFFHDGVQGALMVSAAGPDSRRPARLAVPSP